MIHSKAQFFSSCGSVKPDELFASKMGTRYVVLLQEGERFQPQQRYLKPSRMDSVDLKAQEQPCLADVLSSDCGSVIAFLAHSVDSNSQSNQAC